MGSEEKRAQAHPKAKAKANTGVGVQKEQVLAVVTKSKTSPLKKTNQSQQKEVSKAKKLDKSLPSDDQAQPVSSSKLISSSLTQPQDPSLQRDLTPQKHSQKKAKGLACIKLEFKTKVSP